MKKRLTALALTAVLAWGLAAPAAAAYFADVPANYWGAEGIQYVTQRGLFGGDGPNTFSPNAPFTRSMLVQVLYRYAGEPAVSGTIAGNTAFTDIPQGAYYADAVLWALDKGILPVWFYQDSRKEEDRSKQFRPDQAVNRAEMCLILYAYHNQVLGLEYDESLQPIKEYLQQTRGQQFPDVTLGSLLNTFPELANYSFFNDIPVDILFVMAGWGYHEGIISGTSDHTMSPDLAVSRAQAAVMLMQFDRKYGGAA